MRIGIILHPYDEEKPAGLGRAILGIAKSLLVLDQVNDYVIFLRKKPRKIPELSGKNWRVAIADSRWFWLDRAIRKNPVDVCIFNTPAMPFFVKPEKSVVIVYDFAYVRYSPSFLLKLYHRYSLKRADHIAAISQATKEETLRLFGLPEQKISVVHLGYENMRESIAAPLRPLPDKFFFFAGVIKERKNVLGLVRAFHRLKEDFPCPHKLIIAGHGNGAYASAIQEYIARHKLEKEIFIYEDILDRELAPFYKNAEALIFPSFVEGFGFPILEAMSCGTPVITSDCSSLAEVAGGAALLVDPYRVDTVAQALRRVIEERELRETLIAKGYERLKDFSWEKTGREYLKLIQTL